MIRYIIIVAGGSGKRMNSETPKQFLLIAGKPILMHTIEKFHSADDAMKIILVLPEKETKQWEVLCGKHNFKIAHQVASGGETRFHSVKNGLALVKEKSIVGVHDGVRPLLSTSLINRCFTEAEQKGNAVPCVSIQESIRKIMNGANEIVDRDSFVLIQTPQCFDSEVLKRGYASEFKNSFTDDASVVESAGEKINLVEGERENIKITFPFDLVLAESAVSSK